MACSRCGGKLTSLIRGSTVHEPGAFVAGPTHRPVVNAQVKLPLLSRLVAKAKAKTEGEGATVTAGAEDTTDATEGATDKTVTPRRTRKSRKDADG